MSLSIDAKELGFYLGEIAADVDVGVPRGRLIGCASKE